MKPGVIVTLAVVGTLLSVVGLTMRLVSHGGDSAPEPCHDSARVIYQGIGAEYECPDKTQHIRTSQSPGSSNVLVVCECPRASASASASVSPPAPSVTEAAAASVSAPAPTIDLLFGRYSPATVAALKNAGIEIDPDGEVCRAINTTCDGSWPQDRCRKSKTSWTALLTSVQVDCVTGAQRLSNVCERARWIRECGAGMIDCRSSGCP